MGQLIKFIVDYEADGDPVVYKVDDFTYTKLAIDAEGRLIQHMEFDVHVATEDELEEYKKG